MENHVLVDLFLFMTDPSVDGAFAGFSQAELPIVGFTLVVILCIYLAIRAFKEYSTENRLKSAMYEETGITSSYEYELPEDEKVFHHFFDHILSFH